MLTPSSTDPKRAERLAARKEKPHEWGTPYKTIVKTIIEKSVPSGDKTIKAEMELKDKKIESLQGDLNQERDIALGLEQKVKDAIENPSEEVLLTWSKSKLIAYAVFRFEQELSDSLSVKKLVAEVLSLMNVEES